MDYQNRGYLLEVKEAVVEMALNGRGIRDTARVLNISPWTVMSELKKGIGPEIGERSGALWAHTSGQEGGAHQALRRGRVG